MVPTTMKAAVAGLAVSAAAALGGVTSHARAAGAAPPPAADAPGHPGPSTRCLADAREALAREICTEGFERVKAVTLKPSEFVELCRWSRTWMEDQLRLATGPASRTEPIRRHLDRMKELEHFANTLAEIGECRITVTLKVRYFLLEAEQMLADAQAARSPSAVGQ